MAITYPHRRNLSVKERDWFDPWPRIRLVRVFWMGSCVLDGSYSSGQVIWLFAFWGVGVVFEASRGLWTVSWDDDRTQELASGASSTKTRTQFGYPNFVQHPKTLQFQRCDFNV